MLCEEGSGSVGVNQGKGVGRQASAGCTAEQDSGPQAPALLRKQPSISESPASGKRERQDWSRLCQVRGTETIHLGRAVG